MNVERYSDRFDMGRYQDDPEIGVFAYDQADDQLVFPERVWFRMNRIGVAYELHYLPMVDSSLSLNATQTQGLLDEVAFVRSVVNDPLLERCLVEFIDVLAIASRSDTQTALCIEID